jgi:hypothetical protein
LLDLVAMEREPMAYSVRITWLLAAVACVLAPICAAAQPSATPSDVMMNPSQHLADAQQRLDRIPNPVQADARKPLAALRRHLAELASTYLAYGSQIGPAIMRPASTDPPDWRDSFSNAERDLTLLIGGGPSRRPSIVARAPVAPSAIAADPNASAVMGVGSAMLVVPVRLLIPTDLPTGTTGVGVPMPGFRTQTGPADADAGYEGTPGATVEGARASATDGGKERSKGLDQTTREELGRLRLDLELFYASTMRDATGDPTGDPVSAQPPQPASR